MTDTSTTSTADATHALELKCAWNRGTVGWAIGWPERDKEDWLRVLTKARALLAPARGVEMEALSTEAESGGAKGRRAMSETKMTEDERQFLYEMQAALLPIVADASPTENSDDLSMRLATAALAKARALLAPAAREVEMEALSEGELDSVVDEWSCAPYPEGDYKSNVQKQNAGYRQLAEMAAEAQLAKGRPVDRAAAPARQFTGGGTRSCEPQPEPAKSQTATPAIDAWLSSSVVRVAVAKEIEALRERAERAEADYRRTSAAVDAHVLHRQKLCVTLEREFGQECGGGASETSEDAAVCLLRTMKAELEAAKAELAKRNGTSLQVGLPAVGDTVETFDAAGWTRRMVEGRGTTGEAHQRGSGIAFFEVEGRGGQFFADGEGAYWRRIPQDQGTKGEG